MIIFIIIITIDYIDGIIKLKKLIDHYKFKNYSIIINSIYNFTLNFEYKKINMIKITDFIKYLNINDNDFIVYINGNFILKSNNSFMKYLYKLDNGLIDADVISKYFFSDLFGIRAKFLKMIDNNKNFELEVERVKSFADENKQIYIETLGININPKSKSKFTIY